MSGQANGQQGDSLKSFPTGHALIVGISKYPAAIGPLPEAVRNDAEDLERMLLSPECGYSAGNVKTLIDGVATLANIRAGLDYIGKTAKEEDFVLIFFSGHGALISSSPGTSALVPVDCDPSDPSSTVLQEGELSSSLGAVKAKKLLVMIDACHSAGAASLKNVSDGLKFGYEEKSLSRVASGVGRVVIASSRSSEYSMVFGGHRNSVFTRHALDGLRGHAYSRGDGYIRVFDLFNYISEQVRRSVPDAQHPIFKAAALEDNFPLSLYKGGRKNITDRDQIAASQVVDDWSQLKKLMVELYPGGPEDQSIWERAGGDISRLTLTGSGYAKWFSALKILRLGGGGAISRSSLLQAAQEEFPHHPGITATLSMSE